MKKQNDISFSVFLNAKPADRILIRLCKAPTICIYILYIMYVNIVHLFPLCSPCMNIV